MERNVERLVLRGDYSIGRDKRRDESKRKTLERNVESLMFRGDYRER